MYNSATTAKGKLSSPVLFKMDVCVHFFENMDKSIIIAHIQSTLDITISHFTTMAAFIPAQKTDFLLSFHTNLNFLLMR